MFDVAIVSVIAGAWVVLWLFSLTAVRRIALLKSDQVLIGGSLLLGMACFLPLSLVVGPRHITLLALLAGLALIWLTRHYVRPEALVFAALGLIVLMGAVGLAYIAEGLPAVLMFVAALPSPVALFRLWRIKGRYAAGDHRPRRSAKVEPSKLDASSQAPPTYHVRGSGWQPGDESEGHADRTGSSGGEATGSSGGLVGEVRGFRERTETNPGMGAGSKTIWTFRLERFREGTRLPPVAVEIRGRSMSGSISDGDTISLGGWHIGRGVVKRQRVYNVTTGTSVGVATSTIVTQIVGYIVLAGIVIAIIAFIASR